MIGRSPDQGQRDLFLVNLKEFINPKHELCMLADKMDWEGFEGAFEPLYSRVGCRAKPIRLMVGLLILKQLYDLGDETVMAEWVANPYYQYFCGEAVFQWKPPCDPSDLVHFRHRIGESGVEKILSQSILIHGEKVLQEDISVDTTAQEKNIAYPTDTRLAVKMIEKCRKIAKKENVILRQSYRFELKRLVRLANFEEHACRQEKSLGKKKDKDDCGPSDA